MGNRGGARDERQRDRAIALYFTQGLRVSSVDVYIYIRGGGVSDGWVIEIEMCRWSQCTYEWIGGYRRGVSMDTRKHKH
jgi:hypothetical protein